MNAEDFFIWFAAGALAALVAGPWLASALTAPVRALRDKRGRAAVDALLRARVAAMPLMGTPNGHADEAEARAHALAEARRRIYDLPEARHPADDPDEGVLLDPASGRSARFCYTTAEGDAGLCPLCADGACEQRVELWGDRVVVHGLARRRH